MKLREEYKERMGASFKLGEFHDRLLSYGMPPVKIVRLAMLGDARGAEVGSGNNADVPRTIDFSVLATGRNSSYEGARSIQLITNRNDWLSAWRVIGGGSTGSMPEVSFDTRAVLLVYQGQKRTGGYGISVAEIRREGTALTVRVNEQTPKPGEMTAQVLTSPFIAVSIPRPVEGTVVKFEDEVKKIEQNRNVNQRRYPVPRWYRRKRLG